MKTVTIQYLTTSAKLTDLGKILSQTVVNESDPLAANGCMAHQIDDVTANLLVPDNFDASQIGGVVLKPTALTIKNVFMGHVQTPMITDKLGAVSAAVVLTAAIDVAPVAELPI